MNTEIVRKQEKEITSIGAAIAAGLHVKFWESTDVIKELIKVEK
jgi:glycerol kinase